MDTLEIRKKYQVQEFHTFNPEAMTESIQTCEIHHVQMSSGILSGRISHSRLPYTRLDWGCYNVSMATVGYLPGDVLTFGALLNTKPGTTINGFSGKIGDFMAMSEGQELYAHLQPDTEWMIFHVPRVIVERLQFFMPKKCSHFMRASEEKISRLSLTMRGLHNVLGPQRLENLPSSVAHAAFIWIEEALIQLFVEAQVTSNTTKYAVSATERLQLVRAAEQFIRECPHADLRVDALCVETGAHPRTLERAFHQVHGVSPKRFLTLRRLSLARQDLLSPQPQKQTVTDVAMSWGFFHVSRFAAEYSRMFGEAPSLTLQRSIAGMS